ncbi:MAG: FtsX-like permease family protein [Lachnospiraceae bacterium]|nr:FtsX-like permease family protein [Lachnospiraceae bacterium]
MLFKLAVKNIKNSLRDYAIYFYTLVIGVAIFYSFNSVTSQKSLQELTGSRGQTASTLGMLTSGLSIFVAIVLGLLIVYASSFLMKRRSREFAVYMMLGMGKGKVSAILLIETVLTGLVSLIAGLMIGMGVSQLMGILTIKLFQVDMSAYRFTVSVRDILKTIGFFLVMYLVTMIFNSLVVGKMKLIDLLQSEKKTETIRLRNPVLCVVIFVAGAVMLGLTYYTLTVTAREMEIPKLSACVVAIGVATFLIMWSVSGMFLRIALRFKGAYYSGINTFTIRQITGKMGTIVSSMTVICLMLFLTLAFLITAFSMRKGLNDGINNCKADMQLKYHEIVIGREPATQKFDDIVARYRTYGYDLTSHFDDYVHFHTYFDPGLACGDITGKDFGRLDSALPFDIVKLSDYNTVAGFYGDPGVTLADGEFILMCTYAQYIPIYNKSLDRDDTMTLFGHTLVSKYPTVQKGYIRIDGYSTNAGLFIVPDPVVDEAWAFKDYFIGNYRLEEGEKREDLDALCRDEKDMVEERLNDDQEKGLADTDHFLQMSTRTETIEGFLGFTANLTIVGLYLGIIFLIACGAILALRCLSDCVDSVPRYTILRKIGVEERTISRSLFAQTAVVFLLPLTLSVLHAVFAVGALLPLISVMGVTGMSFSVFLTAGVILLIYGGYFAITYRCGKEIISKERTQRTAAETRAGVRRAAIAWAVTMAAIAVLVVFTARGSREDYSTGTPWLAPDVDGNVTEKTPASAKDNFALYVNKEDILQLEIPKGESYAGPRADLEAERTRDIRALFEGDRPEGHDPRLAYDMYRLMNDWAGRDALGASPLQKLTDQVEALSSIEELSDYLSMTPPEETLAGLWNCAIQSDPMDADRYIITVSPSGLFLEDSAEYLNPTKEGRQLRGEKTALFLHLMKKIGYTEKEAERKIENCIAFEKMLAASCPTQAEKASPSYRRRTANYLSREELIAAQKDLPILQTIENGCGFPESDTFRVTWPAYLDKLSEVYTQENLPLIRDALIVNGADAALASRLDRQCCSWSIRMDDPDNKDPLADYDKTSVSLVSGRLVWPVSKLYADTWLKEEDRETVSALVDEIMAEYHGIIEEADFLSEATRKEALAKLETMKKHVMYPDDWTPFCYDDLDITPPEEGGTFWDAYIALERYDRLKSIEEYQKPVNKELWSSAPDSAPTSTNCAYDPSTNSIYICGAYVKARYRSDSSKEELYALVGRTIGHEIGHAFDYNGSKYDKDGNRKNWWTDEDAERFRKKNEKLAMYLSSIHPWEGNYTRGNIKTGEAAADMTGMKCILRLAEKDPAFDYDRFFRAYAHGWLTRETPETARIYLDDPHPMNYQRVNVTLQQFDEFLSFYDIKEGDGMYLAPEKRVSIW